jgi:hypothetical protein
MHNCSNSRVNIMYSTVRTIMSSYTMNLRIVWAMQYDISYGSYDMTYVRYAMHTSYDLSLTTDDGGQSRYDTTGIPVARSMRAPLISFWPRTPFWCPRTGISGSGHRNPEFRPERTTSKHWPDVLEERAIGPFVVQSHTNGMLTIEHMSNVHEWINIHRICPYTRA